MNYVTFRELPKIEKAKTKVIAVEARSNGVFLGTIKWYGNWRQYTFWPEPETIFSSGCITDIQHKLDEENARHRQTAHQRRQP